jgi:pyrimidine-nucleoside phosphorylase
MIIYQHGDPRVIDDYSLFPQAKNKIPVISEVEGYVQRLNALEIGVGAMMLGAGRENKNDIIDLAVGIEVIKKVGDYVNKGDVLAYLYSNGKNEQQVYQKVLNGYKIVKEKVEKSKLILEVIK